MRVIDSTGRILAERSFAHTGGGIAAFAQWLHEVVGGVAGQAAIAIEVPRGAVVETLAEHGFHLYVVHHRSRLYGRHPDLHQVFTGEGGGVFELLPGEHLLAYCL